MSVKLEQKSKRPKNKRGVVSNAEFGISLDRKSPHAITPDNNEHDNSVYSKQLNDLQSIVVYDLSSDGKIIGLSPAFKKITGWEAKDWVGRKFGELFYTEEQPANEKNILNKYKHVRKTTFKARVKTKKGKYKLVNFRQKPSNNERLKGKEAVSRDLNDFERFYNRIFIQYLISQALISSTDFKRGVKDVLRYMGVAFDWDYGCYWSLDGKKDLIVLLSIWSGGSKPKGFKKLLINKDFLKKDSLINEVLENKKPVWFNNIQSNESFLRRDLARTADLKTAFAFPIKYKDHVLAVVEFFSKTDKEKDKDAEKIVESISFQLGHFIRNKELEKATRLYLNQNIAILKNIPDAVLVENGKREITYCNDNAVKIFGFESSDALMGMNFKRLLGRYDIFDQNEKHLTKAEFLDLEFDRDDSENTGLRFVRTSNGEAKWLSVRRSIIKDDNGDAEMIIKVFRDVSKEVEDKKQRELFLGVLSHEFRSPLASIKAYNQLLQRRIQRDGDKKALEYIKNQDIQNDKLIKLINDLLELTKIRFGKLKLIKHEFDIVKMVNKTINSYKPFAKNRNIKRIGKRELTYLGDEDRLSMVFNNLLSNAIKYSKPNKEILVKVFEDNNNAGFSVKDKGIGIKKKDMKRIFGLFARVDSTFSRRVEGLGMGLSIAQAIVEEHGGRIQVSSKISKGSEFKVILPINKGLKK